MKKYVYKALLSFSFLWGTYLMGQNPVEFELIGDNLDSVYSIADFKLTIGLDVNATNGPGLDEFDVPGSPPSLFVNFRDTVFFTGNETPLIEEFKDLNENTAVWQLRIEFGDPSLSGAANGDITLSWEESGGINPFNDASYSAFTAQLVSFGEILTGGQPLDMKTTTSKTFSPSRPNQVLEDVYISLTKQSNTAPIARDDTAAAFIGQSITLDVLANDTDVDDGSNANLTITSQTSANATISPDGKSITFSTTVAGLESFTYNISDGVEEVTGNVSVTVGDLVFTRELAESMPNPTEGAEITIRVSYSVAPAGDIVLEENFPRFDDALGFWTIPALASGLNGLDIGGDAAGLPDSVTDREDGVLTVTPTSPIVKFTWNTPHPATGFSFSYRIVGNENDAVEKAISGSLNSGFIIETKFTPESCTFHDADTNVNFKIDISEVFRVITLFNNNRFYEVDPPTEDGYAPSDTQPTANSRYHDADTNKNWKIDISEVFRVITLFNNNLFYDCDPTTEDGYIPIPTDPTQ